MQSKQKKRMKPKIRAGTFTVTDYHYPVNFGHVVSFVPFIRLQGKWLKIAGFYIEQEIKVCLFKDRLIIVPHNPYKP